LEATHRWRADAKLRSARGAEELSRSQDELVRSQEELARAREELAEGTSKLEAATAEGKARVERLHLDLGRATQEKAQVVEKLSGLQSRFEELSGHAERMEAKIGLIRRVPLAGWLWDLVSRFR
jgi:predicted nuclease with TOPRIM domain